MVSHPPIFFYSTPFISAPICTINNSPLPLLCTTANHYSIVSATTGCPAAMTDNNDPDDTVMASVFPGDRPMSFVAEAPLTVIAQAGYNNDTATVAFAVATTTGTAAATHGAGTATLVASSEIVNAAQTHVAATAASEATLVVMTAASETENAPFDTAPPLNVATSYASFPPSTYCQNEEDFVASLLSSAAVGKNEDTTPAVGGEKTGVASSAGGLDEDTPQDSLAEQGMELHYYRSHKASFNMQAFPPGVVTASNTKFKPKIQIDRIRNVVHTSISY